MGQGCSYPVGENKGLAPQKQDLARCNYYLRTVMGMLEPTGD